MSKIARYQGNVRAFASDARGMERTVFGGTNQADDLTSQITASFLRGWGIVGAAEHPSLEDFNAAMYAMSQFIAYQHQMGVPEWHAEQEYHIGSICTHNGESYQSLQNANVGSQPPSEKWTPVLTSKNGLTYLGLEETAKQAAGALQKSQNGGDIPDKTAFIENLGMTETLNPTKRVSIGNIGNGAFDGSTPCINIGDSDSGFIGSADGVLDIYCNNAKVGYIDSSGIHLNDQGLHIGDARMGADGNIWGTRWNASGQWLWDAIVEQLNTRGTIDWINNQLSIRDRNINARAAISQVIGIGQTYRVVTDKFLGVTYTNTSQKPWVVLLKINLPASGEVQIKVNGVMAAGGNASNTAGVAVWAYPSAIVPAGATYVVESSWGNVIQWVELQ
ncbi:hypothetical protein ACV67C_001726 [Salmonella enterica]